MKFLLPILICLALEVPTWAKDRRTLNVEKHAIEFKQLDSNFSTYARAAPKHIRDDYKSHLDQYRKSIKRAYRHRSTFNLKQMNRSAYIFQLTLEILFKSKTTDNSTVGLTRYVHDNLTTLKANRVETAQLTGMRISDTESKSGQVGARKP